MDSEPTCLPPDPDPRAPHFEPPEYSCDTHCHVFGPAETFPYSEQRSYTPPDSPFDELWKLHGILGVDRAVVVQASVQGTDNAAVLDAIERSGGCYRGVASIDGNISDKELEALHEGGIRGVRLSFIQRHGAPPDVSELRRMAERIAPLGWHLVLHAGLDDVTGNADALVELPVPVVIDHMAKPAMADGIGQSGFQAFLSLVGNSELWVKISAADRHTTKGPPYEEAVPFGQALIEAAPGRILWGSDWPHPNIKNAMPKDGDLLDLMTAYAPDEAVRKAILVDNPQVLYQFDLWDEDL